MQSFLRLHSVIDSLHLLSDIRRLHHLFLSHMLMLLLSLVYRLKQEACLIHLDHLLILNLLQTNLFRSYQLLNSNLLPAIWSHQFWYEETFRSLWCHRWETFKGFSSLLVHWKGFLSDHVKFFWSTQTATKRELWILPSLHMVLDSKRAFTAWIATLNIICVLVKV